MTVLHRFFNSLWYGHNPLAWLLWPLSLVFKFISRQRRNRYLNGQSPAFHPEVPVIVVGNISVGGTGKTPVTIWLIEQLQKQGLRPGVVSRGYGGKAPRYPHTVSDSDSASVVGDEPLMIHLRTGVPVVVDPDRSAAARSITGSGAVDVIISDDGLQHYGLSRTVELVVVDGSRGFGNGKVLPMGPLREPIHRLQSVDAVIVNGGDASLPCSGAMLSRWGVPEQKCFPMQVEPGEAVGLNSDSSSLLHEALQQQVTAIAGIGNPQRFFSTLQHQGIKHLPVSFPDHHDYSELDLEPYESGFVLTTEKDAVKLRRFTGLKGAYLPINAQIQPELIDVIMQRLEHFQAHHRHLY